jgi:hypothetical protein
MLLGTTSHGPREVSCTQQTPTVRVTSSSVHFRYVHGIRFKVNLIGKDSGPLSPETKYEFVERVPPSIRAIFKARKDRGGEC